MQQSLVKNHLILVRLR